MTVDRLDPGPFLAWLDSRIEHHAKRLRFEARYAGTPAPTNGALVRALAEVGWDDETGQRRASRWRTETQTVAYEDVLDALDRAGIDVYERLAA